MNGRGRPHGVLLVVAALAATLVLAACGQGGGTPGEGTGDLTVAVTGLPGGAEADVDVSGPGGFSEHLTDSDDLTDLEPGTYTVAAVDVSVGGETYLAEVHGSPATVAANATATVDVAYERVGFTISDAEAVVPFGYGPGREETIRVIRSGGFEGAVDVSIDTTELPGSVTISDTDLTIATGETEGTLTLTSDGSESAADLDDPASLAMTATAAGDADTATLTVQVSAVVMTTDDDGAGSLRQLDYDLSTPASGDLVVVSFDPAVFDEPTTIQLASNIDIHQGRHFRGPVNADGEALVTLRGADTDGIIGVKDFVDGQFSNLNFANGRGANGGAIYNAGTLTIENCTITGGEATSGGGIFNQFSGVLTVRDTTITLNTADEGGGIYNNGGTVEVVDTVIEDNTAASDGGGLYNDGTTVSGTLHVGEASLSESHVVGNEASNGDGGGIANTADGELTVVRSVIDRNEALGVSIPFGGGIDNLGKATISLSEILQNEAGFGGAVSSPLGSELRIDGSTLSGNVVTLNGGAVFSSDRMAITNSTIADNEAARGGGLYVSSNAASTATVAFSTIAGNTSDEAGGGLYYSGEVSLRGTVIAGNDAVNGDGPDVFAYGSGSFDTYEYNLIGDPTDSALFGTPNLTGEDPLLGELQDNGGPTATMALAGGSPAIDVVPQSSCLDASGGLLDRDQRGEARPSGADYCDIGAFEVP